MVWHFKYAIEFNVFSSGCQDIDLSTHILINLVLNKMKNKVGKIFMCLHYCSVILTDPILNDPILINGVSPQ